jgi:hypothetical protein
VTVVAATTSTATQANMRRDGTERTSTRRVAFPPEI